MTEIKTEVITDEEVNEKLDELGVDFDHIANGEFDISKIDDVLEALGVIDETPMTDEQIDAAAELFAEKNSEDDAIYEMAKIKAAEDHEDDFTDTRKATITYDHATGRPILEVEDDDFDDLEAMLASEEYRDIPEASLDEYELPEEIEEALNTKAVEDAIGSASSEYGLTTKESMDLLSIIDRIRKGEKIKGLYNMLPTSMKAQIDDAIVKNGMDLDMPTRNNLAQTVMDNVLGDITINKEFMTFNEIMKKELSIPSTDDLFNEILTTHIDESLKEYKVQLLEAGHIEQADRVDRILASIDDAASFARIKEAITSKKDKIIKKMYNVDDNYNRVVTFVNKKMEASPLVVKDCGLMVEALMSVRSERGIDNLKRFVIAFSTTCNKLSRDVIEDCAYIHYTIKNITDLFYVDPKSITDLSQRVLDNLDEVLSMIDSAMETYQSERNSNPKKKG